MTWIDAETRAVARQLREPTASLHEYTRRLRRMDPLHGGQPSVEDRYELHATTGGRVLFPGCVRPIRDMRGSRFGMLTVVGYAGRRNCGDTMWVCRCDCGKVGTKAGRNLMSGNSKSCGCQRGRKKGGTHADQEHQA